MLKEKEERRSRERCSEREMVIERERGEKRGKYDRERQNSKSRQVTPKRGWRVLAKEAGVGRNTARERRGENWYLGASLKTKLQNFNQQTSAGLRTIQFYDSSEQV